jgi:integrase/recombinase XerD
MDNKLRCLILFENSCKSKKTFVTYIEFLDRFLKWSHKDFKSLLLVPQIELEEILQDYCIYLKKRVDNKEISPNSVPYFFNGIFKFLKVNRKKIDQESITQLFPEKSKLGGDLAITTEQCKILLDSTGDKRDKALIHVFSATGARPEAICELQLKNMESHHDGFFKLILYSGHSHEMVTFLHPEAAKAVTEYLEWRRLRGENLTEDSYVFKGNFLECHEKMSNSVMETTMTRLWKNSGIKRKKIGNNYDIATIRGFRKRFDTVLEMNPEVSMGATQYLMDHAGYLSGKHYRRPTVEQLFEAYKKATSDLIINSESRLKLEIKQKDMQFKENESEKDKRITNLEKKLANVEILLLELRSNGI